MLSRDEHEKLELSMKNFYNLRAKIFVCLFTTRMDLSSLSTGRFHFIVFQRF